MLNKKEILFPYPKIRKTQDEFIKKIISSLKEKTNLLAHVPTGIGKTVAVFSSILSQIKDKDLTLFFLTPRHTQHKIAIDTLKEIKSKFNLKFNAMDLIGKKWMCSAPGIEDAPSSQFSEYCKDVRSKDLCEYYLNVTSKQNRIHRSQVKSQLKEFNPLHVEDLYAICKKEKLCSYYLSIELAKKAKVIIADYHHVLNPSIRTDLFEKLGKEESKVIYVFDEAHNLIDRSRDILTHNLSTITIDLALKEAKNFQYDDLIPIIEKIGKLFQRLSKKISLDKYEILIKKKELTDEIGDYDEIVETFLEAGDNVLEDKRRSYLKSIGNFLGSWIGEDEGFSRIFKREFIKDQNVVYSLQYSCLDPSFLIKPLVESSYFTLAMSGTLRPIEVYKDLLGIEAETVEYPSIFPKKNQLNLIVPGVTTKFTLRDELMYKKIAAHCASVVNVVPGNSLILFPSYSFRDTVYETFQNICEKTTFLEQRGLSKVEKNNLLEKFKNYKDQGAVLLGVSNGSFSEGIDLPGDLLKAVLIVGLPLSKPDLYTNELIQYYNKLFNQGWNYGYVYPAFLRCLQGAGRCIRSETDKGVILFMDERYSWRMYSKLFPEDVELKVEQYPVKPVREFFE